MNKIILVAAIAATSFSASSSELYSVKAANEIKGYSQDELAYVTKELNKQYAKDMPIQIDEVTKIESMYFMTSNRSMNYSATVDLDFYGVGVDESKEALEQGKKILANNLCKIYATRTMLEADFTIYYRYSSQSNEYITTLEITKKDCK